MKTPHFLKEYTIELDKALNIKQNHMGNWVHLNESDMFNSGEADQLGIMLYVELITEKRTQILDRLFSRYMSLVKAKYKKQLGIK